MRNIYVALWISVFSLSVNAEKLSHEDTMELITEYINEENISLLLNVGKKIGRKHLKLLRDYLH